MLGCLFTYGYHFLLAFFKIQIISFYLALSSFNKHPLHARRYIKENPFLLSSYNKNICNFECMSYADEIRSDNFYFTL